MNARQKAKKYKKLAEINKAKADAYDRYMRAEALKRQLERSGGEIKTIKVVKYWDDRFPEEFVKDDIAREFGNFCLENNLIDFKIENNYNEYNKMRRVVATLKVAKEWGEENEVDRCR